MLYLRTHIGSHSFVFLYQHRSDTWFHVHYHITIIGLTFAFLVCIRYVCEKHLHALIMSLSWEIQTHKPSSPCHLQQATNATIPCYWSQEAAANFILRVRNVTFTSSFRSASCVFDSCATTIGCPRPFSVDYCSVYFQQ